MSSLAPSVRDRLVGSLELAVGGATPGEQLAACAALARILDAHKLRWRDVIISADHAPLADDDDLALAGRWPGGWRGAARDCVERGNGILSEWELHFCANLVALRSFLSRKQAKILRRLLERLTLEGAFAR